MHSYHSILLPVDFSESSEPAIGLAANLALAVNASVTVLFIDVLHAPADDYVAPDAKVAGEALSEKETSRRISDLVSRFHDQGVRAEGLCRNSMAIAPAILDEAESIGADLIVAGTHGHRGMRRFLLGSVTDELLRTAEIPVILVPPAEHYSPSTIRRIVLPVDFSVSTKQQVRETISLARVLDAEVHLLHVIEPLPLPLMFSGVGTLSDLVPSLQKEIGGEMERLEGRFRAHGLATRSSVVEGSAAREIVRVAEEDQTDLIVIARHGLSRMERLLLGSITERVARTSVRPVLVFPDARFGS